MKSQVVIPQANPGASYLSRKQAIDEAVRQVLASGWYIYGEQCKAFEAEFAAWMGISGVVGVGNGTDALEIALRALNIGVGDEVITVSHTAVATVAAIELTGATPVLADIDPQTYTLDPAQIEQVITERTRAIIPVHLYGMPADMAPILRIANQHDLKVIEDCAQAHGASYQGKRVGTMGTAAAFSFYPTKNLGAFGDGGAVASHDEIYCASMRRLAQYGWHQRYISDEAGMNSRLDELQAAILRIKLCDLDQDNARRRAIAQQYSAALAARVGIPRVPDDRQSVFHLYVIRHPERERLRAHLAERGIGTAIHFPIPIHLQPAYRGKLGDVGSFPQTEHVTQEILSLPIYPELTDTEIDTVITAICDF
jgi:dTDP-4-amino-4,6-dideoxygalactose transaminase